MGEPGAGQDGTGSVWRGKIGTGQVETGQVGTDQIGTITGQSFVKLSSNFCPGLMVVCMMH